MNDAIAITISGRFNESKVALRDQIGTALNGNHKFHRFNPAAGITFQQSATLGFYAGYSESNRIPTPVELTCADENDPCRLPNAFLADPPLLQVVGKSWEIGARGTRAEVDWHLGAFRTTNEDDIIFISAGALTNEGFFSNVGDTRRQGIELSLKGSAFERLDWFLNYTYLSATFEENLALASENNPAAIDSEVFVSPGDRIPLSPDTMIKFGMDYAATDKLSFGTAILHNADMYFRGDEGNDFAQIPGYTVLNLRAEYLFNERIAAFITLDNVFDRDYETFGLFGDPAEVLGDTFSDPRFLGPSAPRAAWIGVRLDL
jgi:outer membrane receptor protein involved in Fe transport